MRTKSVKAPSDSTLQTLWRKVVRAEWRNECALGMGVVGLCNGDLECHHEKRRRIPHLRHCPTNGVLLCQYHHGLMKYRAWQIRLQQIIGEDKMEWLDAMEQKLFPAYLQEIGKTRTEYLVAQKAYLTALLNGDAG